MGLKMVKLQLSVRKKTVQILSLVIAKINAIQEEKQNVLQNTWRITYLTLGIKI